MLDIVFISDSVVSDFRKNLIHRICDITQQKFILPKTLEIEFKSLSKNVYAETSLDHRFQNRISINDDLDDMEIIKPLIHELIHLHQKITGKLSIMRDGSFVWENRTYKISSTMTYQEYKNLPWEADVIQKEKELNSFLYNLSNKD